MHDNQAMQTGRREWMGLLARAPLEILESWAAQHPAAFTWLRRPESGLVMVRARAGGTGDRFNLGEMTVTRCALRLANGMHGIAYVQGRSKRKAELAALADALLQDPCAASTVDRQLIAPLRARLAEEKRTLQRKAQSTRVEFFTVARGET